jgi:multidrug efflux pump subunit AcrA (membrane-fusion protein)
MIKTFALYFLGIPCVLVGGRFAGLDRVLIHETANPPASIVNELTATTTAAVSQVQSHLLLPAPDLLTSTGVLFAEALVAVVVPKHRQSGEAKIAGTLKQVLVSVNDVVAEGAPIAVLNAESMEAEIRKQEQQIRLCESKARDAQDQHAHLQEKLARHRPAAASRAISMDMYNEVKREVNAAAERIEQCEAELAAFQEEMKRLEGRLKDFVVTAPFSGKVTRIYQYAGQYVQPGEVILDMESTEMQVRALVPAEMSSKLQSFTFQCDAESGKRVELAVAEISAQGTISGYQNVVFDLKDSAQWISNQPLAVFVKSKAQSTRPGMQVAQTVSVR